MLRTRRRTSVPVGSGPVICSLPVRSSFARELSLAALTARFVARYSALAAAKAVPPNPVVPRPALPNDATTAVTAMPLCLFSTALVAAVLPVSVVFVVVVISVAPVFADAWRLASASPAVVRFVRSGLRTMGEIGDGDTAGSCGAAGATANGGVGGLFQVVGCGKPSTGEAAGGWGRPVTLPNGTPDGRLGRKVQPDISASLPVIVG